MVGAARLHLADQPHIVDGHLGHAERQFTRAVQSPGLEREERTVAVEMAYEPGVAPAEPAAGVHGEQRRT